MSEEDAIAASDRPRTRASLAADLRTLGVEPGAVVVVHSSLASLGWVNGAAQTVIEALLDTVGEGGTLVMPAQSGHLTDPAEWRAPPAPAEWVAEIRETMPPFDPRLTPTRGMGAIAELFRAWPGVVRSFHPHSSFAAFAPSAGVICAEHPLEDPMGEGSPLARLYDLNATVLLMGVGFESCTALHLAEVRGRRDSGMRRSGAPMMVEGVRRWVTFSEPDFGEHDGFLVAGESLLASGAVRAGSVGSARAIIGPLRSIVDGAVKVWTE